MPDTGRQDEQGVSGAMPAGITPCTGAALSSTQGGTDTLRRGDMNPDTNLSFFPSPWVACCGEGERGPLLC